MRTICVVQHTNSEHLGLMEDHFESRAVRFRYARPFADGGKLPADSADFDGLVLLGAAPFGVVTGDLLPGMTAELRLTADFLARRKPVIGLSTGAILLAVAAGGGAEEAALWLQAGTARRTAPDALGGYLPAEMPFVQCLRDRPVLPADAAVLATGDDGAPAVFRVRGNCIGFTFHPGMKSAMLEDLIMEFDAMPEDCSVALQQLRLQQRAMAAALSEIMIGIVKITGLMADP